MLEFDYLNDDDFLHDRANYTYRCKYCGFECRSYLSPTGAPKTKVGSYGDSCTPGSSAYAEEYLSASTIAFTSTPSITDSAEQFVDSGFKAGMTIRVSTDSGTNDGDYTISERGVAAGEILLEESLTTESASTAGTVTISRLLYQPNVTTGCPFCGSLNSK